jgi:hypothetical protein
MDWSKAVHLITHECLKDILPLLLFHIITESPDYNGNALNNDNLILMGMQCVVDKCAKYMGWYGFFAVG